MEKRATRLQEAGISAHLLHQDEVCCLEPNLSPASVIGALHHANEGNLNPFKLVHAYAWRGRQYGLEVWTHTEATGISLERERVTGVYVHGSQLNATRRQHAATGWVVLANGAWARTLARTAGVDLPLRWVHGEALVTEPLSSLTRHAISSASFFEATEESKEQAVGFCLRQRPEGNVMIGEAALLTECLGRRVTATALPAIAQEAKLRFPTLQQAAVVRGWAIPVAFVPDNRPLLGAVDEVEGLVVASGLKSTIVLTPLAGALVAAVVSGSDVDPRLAQFSPSRRIAGIQDRTEEM
jgi:sarcosine oxidase subunit beta